VNLVFTNGFYARQVLDVQVRPKKRMRKNQLYKQLKTDWKKNWDNMEHSKNWHDTHKETSNFGQRLADSVANGMGSWRFIIIQTAIVAAWMILNVVAFMHHWDPYPYILLNLLFSTQAAYAAPIIMMAQNRQSQRDRAQADSDYRTNLAAKKEIEELMSRLDKIEIEKLDKIIALLEDKQNSRHAVNDSTKNKNP
jgi:uncharacterized membrane protein